MTQAAIAWPMFALKENTKKIARLKKRADFLRVQKAGKKWVSKGMVVELAGNQVSAVRYGLTVSKRVSKSAVIRNRVKRRLRAVAMEVLPAYAPQNLDIVLIGRAETESRDYEDLKNDLIWCLKKMDIKPTTSI